MIMNVYRNKLKIRIAYSAVLVAVLLTVMFLSNMGYIGNPAVEKDFFKGFINGLCFSAVFMSVFSIVRYVMMLKDKKKLKEQYIKENDELKKKIVSDAGTNEYYFIVTGLGAGTIIGGYLNIYVFWSFYIALFYCCIVREILCCWYKRKYKSDESDYEE